MENLIKPRLDILIGQLKKDLKLISQKDKNDEWKRDHYRYIFTVYVQRIYEMLNTQITLVEPAKITPSTKKEMISLRNQINSMIAE